MTTYFVTRHLGALEWARQNNTPFDVHLIHLASLGELQVGDVVIGTLPINLVCLLNEMAVRYIHLSLDIPAHLRGIELSAQQLDAECHASLQEFIVHKVL